MRVKLLSKEEISKNFKWNVYYWDFSKKNIVETNIFQTSISFREDCCFLFNDCIVRGKIIEDFERRLEIACFAAYGSKYEYEISMTRVYPTVIDNEIFRKIDINAQIKMNWEIFVREVKRILLTYIKEE